jgi:predicted N-acetyltransferase YhbS
MMDMLVKLYDLEPIDRLAKAPIRSCVEIRRALPAEATIVASWVKKMFGSGWAGEVSAALSRTPTTCYVALAGQKLHGFACWDVSSLGFFGPIGIDPTLQRRGIGAALLHRCLESMLQQGYGYAVIGGVSEPGFYAKVAGAVPIEGSTPGIYRGLLRLHGPKGATSSAPGSIADEA